MIKKFDEFINENNTDELFISEIDDKNEIFKVYEKQIEKYFWFLGEGELEVDISSVYSPQEGGYYTNETYILWDENTNGGYKLDDLKKAEKILKKLEGKNGISYFRVEEGKITITFEQDYPLELY